jgi:hypothetical protein
MSVGSTAAAKSGGVRKTRRERPKVSVLPTEAKPEACLTYKPTGILFLALNSEMRHFRELDRVRTVSKTVSKGTDRVVIG